MQFRSILLPCVLLLAFSSAHADDASRLAKAEELFKVAHIDELTTQVMQQVFDQVNSGMMQQLMGVKLAPEQQKKLDEFSAKLQKVVTDGMGWKTLEPEYAKLYAATYSEEELDGIVAFYKSPSGQAMVEKSPALVRQSGSLAQSHMKLIAPQIQDLMKQYMSEITATANQPRATN